MKTQSQVEKGKHPASFNIHDVEEDELKGVCFDKDVEE